MFLSEWLNKSSMSWLALGYEPLAASDSIHIRANLCQSYEMLSMGFFSLQIKKPSSEKKVRSWIDNIGSINSEIYLMTFFVWILVCMDSVMEALTISGPA